MSIGKTALGSVFSRKNYVTHEQCLAVFIIRHRNSVDILSIKFETPKVNKMCSYVVLGRDGEQAEKNRKLQ